MKNKYAEWVKKYPLLKYITSWYVPITIFFVLWIVFFDTYSLLDHRHINKEIDKLEDNKAYYLQEIKSDQEESKKLNRLEEVERYAREKYFMKRDSEDIYIIEIDEQYK